VRYQQDNPRDWTIGLYVYKHTKKSTKVFGAYKCHNKTAAQNESQKMMKSQQKNQYKGNTSFWVEFFFSNFTSSFKIFYLS